MRGKEVTKLKAVVSIRIKGKRKERFINDVVRKGGSFFDIEHKEDYITATVYVRDISLLKASRREHEVSFTLHRRTGLPFFMQRVNKYQGFIVGFILFFGIIFALSNVTWGIKIQGATPKTEYEITKKLHSYGIKVGQPLFNISNVEELQKRITNDMPNVTWVGVELRGTVFHLTVVEKQEPKQERALKPRHLVAKKEAVITKIFVEEGKPLVMVNDYVQKGQIIVSGQIGKEDNYVNVAAKGVVYGETWYKSVVDLPLRTAFATLTGSFHRDYFVNIKNVDIPLWGWWGNETYEAEREDIQVTPIRLWKWSLPIGIKVRTQYEKEEKIRSYTVEEAKEEAARIAKRQVEQQISKNGTIISERMIDFQSSNDKIKVIMHFKANENIVASMPISDEIQPNKESNE